MGDINTSKKNTLSALGYTGSIDDAYFKYLLDITGSVIPNDINDLEKKFFKQFGYSGTVGDMYRAYMNDQGLTGTLQDQLYKLWNTGIGLDDSVFTAPLIKSLIPTRGTGAPSFTRATTKTFFDHEGVLRTAKIGEAAFVGARRVENKYLASEDITNAAWVKDGSSVSGSLVTITGGQKRIYQVVATTSGNTYISSLDIKKSVGSSAVFQLVNIAASTTNLNFDTGVLTVATPFTAGAATLNADGSYRVWLKWVSNTSSAGLGVVGVNVSDAFNLTRLQHEDVTGQSVQTAGEYVSVGVLSAPYHGAMVDGVKYFDTKLSGVAITSANSSYATATRPYGYWPEPAATNLLLWSNDLTNAIWSKLGTSAPILTTGALAPDGTSTATEVDLTPAADCRVVNLTGAINNTGMTLSVWLKAKTAPGTVVIGMRNGDGAIVTSAVSVTTSWARYSFYSAGAAGANTAISYVGNRTVGGTCNDFYFFGAQLETGSVATSHIPTTSAAVTRNADVLTYPSAGNISDTVGTVYTEHGLAASPAGGQYAVATNAAAGYCQYHNSGDAQLVRIYDGTTVLASPSGTSLVGRIGKLATTWGGSTMKAYIDGAGSSGAFDGSLGVGSNLWIGHNNGANQLNGPVGNVKIWTRQLSDAYITRITT